MLHTFASHRPSSRSHTLWLIVARLVLVAAVAILALFAGYVGLLVWVMVAG